MEFMSNESRDTDEDREEYPASSSLLKSRSSIFGDLSGVKEGKLKSRRQTL